MGRQINNTDL